MPRESPRATGRHGTLLKHSSFHRSGCRCCRRPHGFRDGVSEFIPPVFELFAGTDDVIDTVEVERQVELLWAGARAALAVSIDLQEAVRRGLFGEVKRQAVVRE